MVVDVPKAVAAEAERFLDVGRERTEAHPGDRDGNLQLDRFLREARAQHRFGRALLAIPFQRIPRHRRRQENEIIKSRHAAFGAQAADLVQPRLGRLMNVGEHLAVERSAFFQVGRRLVILVRHSLSC